VSKVHERAEAAAETLRDLLATRPVAGLVLTVSFVVEPSVRLFVYLKGHGNPADVPARWKNIPVEVHYTRSAPVR
jgi:hypothetical protein